MTDRARRSLANGSPAALLVATAWMAGPSLRHDSGTRAHAAAAPGTPSAWSRPLRVVVP